MNSERPSSAPLVRAIGTLGLAAGIVNITIGGGIFRLPALVAASLGAAAPLAYLVCAVAMGLIVLCIADAGSRVSLTGGPYAYVGTAFGPYAGFLSGVLLWLRVTDTMRNAKPVPAAKRPPVTAVAWSGKVFLNERRFAQWLDSRGASYREWARLHPKAVATFEARHGRR